MVEAPAAVAPTTEANRPGWLCPGREPGETPPAHHWVIESPNGPTSRGKCQFCDEEREFRNGLDLGLRQLQRADSDVAVAAALGKQYPLLTDLPGDIGEAYD